MLTRKVRVDWTEHWSDMAISYHHRYSSRKHSVDHLRCRIPELFSIHRLNERFEKRYSTFVTWCSSTTSWMNGEIDLCSRRFTFKQSFTYEVKFDMERITYLICPVIRIALVWISLDRMRWIYIRHAYEDEDWLEFFLSYDFLSAADCASKEEKRINACARSDRMKVSHEHTTLTSFSSLTDHVPRESSSTFSIALRIGDIYRWLENDFLSSSISRSRLLSVCHWHWHLYWLRLFLTHPRMTIKFLGEVLAAASGLLMKSKYQPWAKVAYVRTAG